MCGPFKGQATPNYLGPLCIATYVAAGLITQKVDVSVDVHARRFILYAMQHIGYSILLNS